MQRIVFLTPDFAVTGALGREDLAEMAAQGFKSVLSNLPEGELRQYPSAAEKAELAARAGLGLRHVPVTKSEVWWRAWAGRWTSWRHPSCALRVWPSLGRRLRQPAG